MQEIFTKGIPERYGIITGFDYSFRGQSIIGDFSAIIDALFIGLYLLLGRKMRKAISATTYIFLVFSSSSFFFALGMLITKTPFFGYPFYRLSVVNFNGALLSNVFTCCV